MRVVSLVPSLTEAVAETAPGLLVGATDWCTHPADLDVPRIRGTKNPDVDGVAALEPDLVLANQEENKPGDLDALRERGLAVYVTDIRDVDGGLDSLGRMLAACRLDEPDWLREARRPGPRSRPPNRGAAPSCRSGGSPGWRSGRTRSPGPCWTDSASTTCSTTRPERYPRFEPTDLPDHDVVVLPDEPYTFTADDGPEAFDAPSALVSGRLLTWYGPAWWRRPPGWAGRYGQSAPT